MADQKNPSRLTYLSRVRAFTLVELLVVIGIIALLISILLPALSRARMTASTLSCQANLHSIGQGLLIYVVDNHGTLPYGWFSGLWNSNGTGQAGFNPAGESDWVYQTVNTLNGRMNTTATGNGQAGTDTIRTRQMFLCPDAPGQGMTAGVATSISHYGCHPRLMPVLDGSNLTPPYFLPYRIARIKRSSEVGLIFEASLFHNPNDSNDTWVQQYTYPVLSKIDQGGLYNTLTQLTDAWTTTVTPNTPVHLKPASPPRNMSQAINVDNNATYYASNIRFRHMKNTVTNVLMVDGHVESFHYNPQTFSTPDLLEKNICVNP
jgi:prepilin-type N-terminal cleavage/methylation domain-containing protein/prepilin-type processing-associated H-X9-DG protein